MTPLAIEDFTVVSALGVGRQAHAEATAKQRSGLVARGFETADLEGWLGVVEGVDSQRLPTDLADYDCRNNRLAWLALHTDGFAASVRSASLRHGAHRIGVFIGTSTSGILQTELAYRRRDLASGALPADFRYAQTHNTYSVADFTRRALALERSGGSGVDSLFVERQGVCPCGADDRAGPDRRGGGGWCRQPVSDHAVRLQVA